MMAARRENSNKLYRVYLNKWTIFCNDNDICPITATVQQDLSFLYSLYQDDVYRGSSAMNIARSALSAVISMKDNTKFGDNPL